MSGSALGRAQVDLDINIAPLRDGLAQAEAQTRAWQESVSTVKPALALDVAPVNTSIEQIIANLDRMAGEAKPIELHVDPATAEAGIADVEAQLHALTSETPPITPVVDTAPAEAQIASVDATLATLATEAPPITPMVDAGPSIAALQSIATEEQAIAAEAGSAASGLERIGVAATEAGTKLSAASTEATGFGAHFAGIEQMVAGFTIATAITQIPAILKAGAEGAAEDEASLQRLQGSVENVGQAWGQYATAIDAAVQHGRDMGYADNVTQDALNRLVTSTGSAEEALRRLSTAQDLARGTGMDLVNTARLLGRITDETHGFLSRYGIQVEKTANAQEVLNAVDARFGGQAGKFANSAAGDFERMHVQIQETEEALASLALPILTDLASDANSAAQRVELLAKDVKELHNLSPVEIVVHIKQDIDRGDLSGALPTRDSIEGALLGQGIAKYTPFGYATNQVVGYTKSLGEAADGEAGFAKAVDLAKGAVDRTVPGVAALDFITSKLGGDSQSAGPLVGQILDVIKKAHAALPAATSDANDFSTSLHKLGDDAHYWAGLQNEANAALARQANAAGDAEERMAEHNANIVKSADLTATLAFVTTNLTRAQEGLAGAYQAGLGIVANYSAQASEYSGQASTLKGVVDDLHKKQQEGIPLTQQETQILDGSTAALARLTGGVQDANETAAAQIENNTRIMTLQDQIGKQFPNLVAGSDAWNTALKEAGKAAGLTDEQMNQFFSSTDGKTDLLNQGLTGLTTAIQDLIKQMRGLNDTPANPKIKVDGIDEAKTGVATVQGDMITLSTTPPAKPKVSMDHSEFDTGKGDVETAASGLTATKYSVGFTADDQVTGAVETMRQNILGMVNNGQGTGHEASFEATGLSGGAYTVIIGGDPSGAVTAAGAAQTAAQGAEGPYTAILTGDASAAYNTFGAFLAYAQQAGLEAGQAAAAAVEAGYNERLGIRSPSTVMAEAGANTGKGIGVGLESASGAVTDAAANVGTSAGDALATSLWDSAHAGVNNAGGYAAMLQPPQPIDWSFLFGGIDMAAKDAGKQMADAINGWLGNLDSIVSGDAGRKANADLQKLLIIRQIEVDEHAPQAAIDQIDAQIHDKQGEIEAIGAIVGTDIVQGMVKQTQAEDAAKQILAVLNQAFSSLNLGQLDFSKVVSIDSVLGPIDEQIKETQTLLAAAQQIGNQDLVDEQKQKLADLYAQEQAIVQLWGTDAVQAFIANKEAMAENEAEAARLKAAHEALVTAEEAAVTALASTDPSVIANTWVSATQKATDALAAYQLAVKEGLDPDVIAKLKADSDAAAQDASQVWTILADEIQNGTLPPGALQKLAEQGGKAFYEWYDAMFGPGALEQIAQGWNTIDTANYQGILDMIPTMADGGASLIEPLTKAYAEGKISAEQFWAAMNEITAAGTDHDKNTVGMTVQQQIDAFQKLHDQLEQQWSQAVLTGAANADELWQELLKVNEALGTLQAEADKSTTALDTLARAAGAALKGTASESGIQNQSAVDALNAAAQAADAAKLQPPQLADTVTKMAEDVTKGAQSYADAMALIASSTKEGVAATISSLQSLEGKLIADQVNLHLQGKDSSAVDAELATVERFLHDLVKPTTTTSSTPRRTSGGGTSTPALSGDLNSVLDLYTKLEAIGSGRGFDARAVATRITSDVTVIMQAFAQAAQQWKSGPLDTYVANVSGAMQALTDAAAGFDAVAGASAIAPAKMRLYFDNYSATLDLVHRLDTIARPFLHDATELRSIAQEMLQAFQASADVAHFVSTASSVHYVGGGNVTINRGAINQIANAVQKGAKDGTNSGFVSAMPAVASGVTVQQVNAATVGTSLIGGM